jgi:hypothetical protein
MSDIKEKILQSQQLNDEMKSEIFKKEVSFSDHGQNCMKKKKNFVLSFSLHFRIFCFVYVIM